MKRALTAPIAPIAAPPRLRRRADEGLRLLGLLGALLLPWGPSCNRNDLTSGPHIDHSGNGSTKPPPLNDCPPAPPIDGLAVLVNEVMAKNTAAFADEHGQFSPWIELYNPTDAPVNLGNVPLSDDAGSPKKWVIPCIPQSVIAAKGFLIIFCDGDTANANDLHANFRLSATAKRLTITLNGGSSSFVLNANSQKADHSTGNFPDGVDNPLANVEPTPGAPNSDQTGTPPDPGGVKFIRGDVNGSGKVNVTDLSLLAKMIDGSAPLPACQDAADVDDDGAIGPADTARLGAALFPSTGATIPPPYPEAGTDPTQDSLACPGG